MRSRAPASPTSAASPDVLCFATQGAGSGDARRIETLLAPLAPRVFPFDRADKRGSARALARELRRRPPALAVMEGTGLAGGLALLAAQRMRGLPYVVSTGDAVGPFLAAAHPRLAPVAQRYERQLYARSAGVIGWSPYLAGRALTLGAPRALTAAHWSEHTPAAGARERVRAQLGIPPDALVVGLVGSLNWNERVGYCYGAELVRAVRRTTRADLRVLIVGDGSGREHLAALAGPELGGRVLLPGACAPEEVADRLAALDAGSLPQSLDQVGALRYTTKLPEYLAAGLPVVTGQLPLAYDLDDGWLWRLPGDAPWDERYVAALAQLLERLAPDELAARSAAVPRALPQFDRERQQRHVSAFVHELLAPGPDAPAPPVL